MKYFVIYLVIHLKIKKQLHISDSDALDSSKNGPEKELVDELADHFDEEMLINNNKAFKAFRDDPPLKAEEIQGSKAGARLLAEEAKGGG